MHFIIKDPSQSATGEKKTPTESNLKQPMLQNRHRTCVFIELCGLGASSSVYSAVSNDKFHGGVTSFSTFTPSLSLSSTNTNQRTSAITPEITSLIDISITRRHSCVLSCLAHTHTPPIPILSCSMDGSTRDEVTLMGGGGVVSLTIFAGI